MSRYIDADEMLKKYENSIYDTTDLAEMLKYMPTVDAVEVVRCKDCRYVFKEDEYSYWCNGFTSPMRLVTPKTFCSHGRRRND